MSNPVRLLVVDDEAQFVLSLTKLLIHRGFEVECAHDGYEALDVLKAKAESTWCCWT